MTDFDKEMVKIFEKQMDDLLLKLKGERSPLGKAEISGELISKQIQLSHLK